MPIFYNPASPTPTTKNTINDIAVDFGVRDFLLNLNLTPQYPQIATNINGSPRIGEPVLNTTVGTGNILIPIGLPLETNGIVWKDLNVILNTFQNDSNVSNNLEQIDYLPALTNPEFGEAIWPTNSQYPTGANTQVEQYGIKGKTEEAQYRKNNVIKNLYLDSASQIDMADFIGLYPLDISQQLGNYVDTFGGLNQGGTTGDQALNVIGSVLNGQGVGLGAGGSIIPNFDFKTSLLSRVLGGTGFIKDTKLGNVGAQQLALALANNAAFNVQQELLGALNIKENIYSLIKDGEFAGFRPNYKITIPSSTGGQILNGVTRVLGFQIPRSYLGDEGSIFQSENGDIANIDRANAMILNTGKGQVKSLISNVIASSNVNLTSNPFRSGYTPAYKNNKGDDAVPSGNTKIYAYSTNGNVDKILGNASVGVDDVIPELNYNREGLTRESGFNSPEELGVTTAGLFSDTYDNRKPNNIGFSWTSQSDESLNKIPNLSQLSLPGFLPNVLPTDITGDKKSLLVKTQKLFNSKGMKNLVSVKGEMGVNSSQIQTANQNGLSKGSGVLSKSRYDLDRGTFNSTGSEADNHFCRSWTTLDRYDSVQKLIRNKPLYGDPDAPHRFQTTNSVLDGPFVKIGPYKGEVEDPKKFMFSIENLAWKDEVDNLPPCEQGPGDLVSGEKGRIMWFPPYDIQFSENNTVNWEETNFIGRGEPIYTYNNTKRTGQLSFKIIVDHPSYFNAFSANREKNTGTNGPDDNFIASFFAGCVDIDKRWSDRLNINEINELDKQNIDDAQVRQDPTDPAPLILSAVYFPNDVKDYVPDYEDGKCGIGGPDIDYITNPSGEGCGLTVYTADVTWKDVKGTTENWPDRYDYGLNKDYNDPNYYVDLVNFLKEYPWAIVRFKGYASVQGNPSSNTKLSDLRASLLRDKFIKDIGPQLGQNDVELQRRFKVSKGSVDNINGCVKETKENPNPPVDTDACKIARRVEVKIEFDPELKSEYIKSLTPLSNKTTYQNFRVKSEIVNKFYTECDYFERLTESDKFVFDSIREKIRYFHPAFHSTTPEGLNSRLTFLLQCTRQGRTLQKDAPNNLAFGRPPICILRIGDFYHTKIAIDNINIGYEPLVWDLNPEGIGVQPMIANIDMSFSFLGGSSLMGPINKLQNALSFNYFANTHVYDPRADYILRGEDNVVQSVNNEISSNDQNVDTTKKLPTYNIIDGISYGEYEKGLSKQEISRELESSTTEQTNQIEDEQSVNGGPENNEQTTSVTDEEIINNISLFNYIKFDDIDNDTLTLLLTYNKKGENLLNLTPNTGKIYKGQVYVVNQQSKINVGYITVSSNGLNQGVLVGSNNSSPQPIANNISNNQTFNVEIIIEDTEKLTTIKDFYNSNNSVLKLEWETNAKSNINFNKNNGV